MDISDESEALTSADSASTVTYGIIAIVVGLVLLILVSIGAYLIKRRLRLIAKAKAATEAESAQWASPTPLPEPAAPPPPTPQTPAQPSSAAGKLRGAIPLHNGFVAHGSWSGVSGAQRLNVLGHSPVAGQENAPVTV